MKIQKLEAYLKVIENGSISKTAKEMGYTQSAISKMIQELEKEWDLKLLTRNHDGVEATTVGSELMPEIRNIIRDYDNLNSSVALLHGMNKGTIRLGTPLSAAAALLPGMLKEFHDHYPNIKVELYEGEDVEIAELLRRGVLDVSILPQNLADRYYAKPLVTDVIVAILPKNHPLAKEEFFPMEAFETEEIISLREELDYDFKGYFEENGIEPNIIYEVSDDLSMFSMVERGLGICIEYGLLLKPLRFDVEVKPISKTKHRNLKLCVKDKDALTPLIELFYKSAEEYFAISSI